MHRLWAPWRAQYIRESSQPDSGPSTVEPAPACFLCRALAAPPDHDRANLVVWRRSHSIVVLNRFPYNNGHLLVAPILHKGRLADLEGVSLTEPLETVKQALEVLDLIFRPQGYNIGLNQGRAAGAGLPDHLHWHIVPRWDGDTNFMPVLGQTKVISESLNEFHDQFVSELARVEREVLPADPKDAASVFEISQ
jgi:ATP adenylyltransferase